MSEYRHNYSHHHGYVPPPPDPIVRIETVYDSPEYHRHHSGHHGHHYEHVPPPPPNPVVYVEPNGHHHGYIPPPPPPTVIFPEHYINHGHVVPPPPGPVFDPEPPRCEWQRGGSGSPPRRPGIHIEMHAGHRHHHSRNEF